MLDFCRLVAIKSDDSEAVDLFFHPLDPTMRRVSWLDATPAGSCGPAFCQFKDQ